MKLGGERDVTTRDETQINEVDEIMMLAFPNL
jgi:hypothetical protein